MYGQVDLGRARQVVESGLVQDIKCPVLSELSPFTQQAGDVPQAPSTPLLRPTAPSRAKSNSSSRTSNVARSRKLMIATHAKAKSPSPMSDWSSCPPLSPTRSSETASSLSASVVFERLNLTRDLGATSFSIVRAGETGNGLTLVFKEAREGDLDSTAYLIDEADTYAHLAPIMGDDIPHCYGLYDDTTWPDLSLALILSDCGPSLDSWDNLTQSQKSVGVCRSIRI